MSGFEIKRLNIGVPVWVFEQLKRYGERQEIPKKAGPMAVIFLVNHLKTVAWVPATEQEQKTKTRRKKK